MAYALKIDERPSYLHFVVTGLSWMRGESRVETEKPEVNCGNNLRSSLVSGQQTPRRWGLGNPAEETICCPNTLFILQANLVSKKNSQKKRF